MTLTAGSRLGPYEILVPLGAGGMGEVYRARDTRLGREVAVKVLPTSFAADAERLQRFELEARAASALNHPNILAVYDIGTHEGSPYVVSELLEGDTLRERIGNEPLPRRKTIEYASQIARGLAAAHDKGIVHRDLKPDTVFVTRDGRVKILDFGLATIGQSAPVVEAETALAAGTGPATAAGTVLGTVGYMSPEQVRGQPVDHRSDIFSFGVVLYEMLTGRRAFKGDSAIETMNATLKEDPVSASDSGQPLPPALEVVTHCLEKNPQPGRNTVLARVPIGGGAPREVLENVRSADWGPDGEALAVVRTDGGRDTLEFPIGHVLYTARGWLSDVAVSPKGDRGAFAEHPVLIDNRGDVAIVDMAGTMTIISTSWEDIFGLHWTPDGDEVWFSASGGGGKTAGTDHAIFAATPAGRVRTVMSAPGSLDLQDIAPDGRALVAHGSRHPSIMALAPNATEETELTWMDFSWVADIASDGSRVLFGEQGVGGGAGYAVYLRGTDKSPAVRLGKGMAQSLSPDGRWALATDLVQNALLVLPTGAGEARTLPPDGIKAYSWAGWFPDGKHVVFAGFEDGKGQRMYSRDLAGGAPRALTPEGVAERANTLSPDGKWIAARSKDQIQLFPVEGGEPRILAGSEPRDLPLGWRTDGRALFVRQGRPPVKIVAIDVASGERTLVHTIAPRDNVGVDAIGDARMTPDGKSYAYVYIRSLYSLYQVTGLK